MANNNIDLTTNSHDSYVLDAKDIITYEQYMEMNVEQRKSVKILHCSTCNLTELPTLYNDLRALYCNDNKITTLPPLPARLLILDCSSNLLSELPHLHFGLDELNYSNNTGLLVKPTIPTTLTILNCSCSLPPNHFPTGLRELHCSNTFFDYDRLPNNLPDTIRILDYAYSEFKLEGYKVKLPENLRDLCCVDSYLPSPSELPRGYLKTIMCTREQMGKKKHSYMKIFPNLEIDFDC